jgi:glycogen debranching enzyme
MDTVVARPRPELLKETAFYIPAKGSPTRHRYKLKHNDTFVVMDSHGDIGAALGEDGVFNNDTRFLSLLELHLNRQPTLLLGSRVRDDNTMLTADLTNPDIYDGSRLVLPKDTVHIVRSSFVWNDTFYTRFGIRNYGDRPIDLALDLWFASDFADIFEVRGLKRERRGTSARTYVDASSVGLSYLARDGVSLATALAFEPDPQHLDDAKAHYRLALNGGERTSVFTAVSFGSEAPAKPEPFFRALRAATRAQRHAARHTVGIGSSSDTFNEVATRSLADLRMLMTRTSEGDYPYAGIPWYSTTFGRDGIITALHLLWCMPHLARGVLSHLAALQATTVDPVNDAEPGKIVHETRGGEMARLREVPFGCYYGSVDATPLFVLLAGEYWRRTSDTATIRKLWPNICAALDWIDRHSMGDADGFLRHSRNASDGLVNQGWKDSYDAVFHADGRLAEGTIALVEVQAYVVAARRSIAQLAGQLGHREMATQLLAQADRLAQGIERRFWCEDLGLYGIAIDGAGELCRVRTSNAGHVLFANAASEERADRVAESLMAPAFLSGWGIRTVAEGEARYNPMSYHNGSIWPHDNSLIAAGFARYGQKNAVMRVFGALFDAAVYMDLRRLPELYCGFQRARGRGPTLYPVACAPQAWAAGAPFLMIQAALGIEFDPERNEISLRDPVLPPFMDEIVLRDLRVGALSVDLAIHRQESGVAIRLLRNEGHVKVAVLFS